MMMIIIIIIIIIKNVTIMWMAKMTTTKPNTYTRQFDIPKITEDKKIKVN